MADRARLAVLAERPLLTALALSLGAHLILLAATGRLWTAMPEEIGFPIEATLAPAADIPELPAPPVRAPATPRPVPEPAMPPAAPERAPEPPQAQPEPPAHVPAPQLPATIAPPPATPAAPIAPPSTPIPAASETAVEAKPEQRAEPAKPSRPALRILPDRLEIRYAVQYGEGGFTAGEARYIWQSHNGRYTLVSTLEAKGLASLFVSGRIVQASEGMVDEGGLRPEQYWSQQGERRQDSARFDWAQNQVVLSGARGNVALVPQAQDLLSFPFQLAVTARAGEPEFGLAVSNGRKLQGYRFRLVGEERLSLPGRAVDTLHLQGGREGAGTLDVWLDKSAMNLPVQVRTLDGKGKQVTLIAEEVAIR